MPLETAKCPSCGANIQVDTATESGYCNYCGTKHFTQAAVCFYKFEISGSIEVQNQTSFGKQLVILMQHLESREVRKAIDEGRYRGEDAKAILKKMQELNPSSTQYCLWKSILDLFPDRDISVALKNKYLPFAWIYSSPEYFCVWWRDVKIIKEKTAFSKRVTETIFKREILSYDKWKKKNTEQASLQTDAIEKWIHDEALINQYAFWFVRFIMNHDWVSHREDGGSLETKDGRIIDFRSANGQGSYRWGYGTFDNSHQREERVLYIADNIIEYFIPFLGEQIQSPNVKLLQDALLEECKKYPNSYY